MIKNCFYCKQEINKPAVDIPIYYMMIPLDNPYINMFMHIECYQIFETWKLIMEHIMNDFDDIWNYYMGIAYPTKKSKNKREIDNDE